MKTEPQAAAAAHTFNTVKDIDGNARQRMEKVLGDLQHAMATIRTGRASVHLLDPVMVKAYGSDMPLNQVGTVNVPEPRMLTVQVWDRGLVSAGRRPSATPIWA